MIRILLVVLVLLALMLMCSSLVADEITTGDELKGALKMFYDWLGSADFLR